MVSAYLEAVAIAAEARANAHADAAQVEAEFRRAVVRAYEHESLRAIGRAAGLTHAGVKYIIEQENART